jgi:hypothetical protein
MGKRRADPAAGSGNRKDQYLQIRLIAEEKEGFEAAARLCGLALSAWVRERLRRAARTDLEEANQPVPFLPGSAQNRNGPKP